MQVTRTNELGRTDLLPNPKIHPLLILADHPAQVHVDALACRTCSRRGNVLLGSGWGILQAKKMALKLNQHGLHAVYCTSLTD